MSSIQAPKGDNFDESYVSKSMPYNTRLANRSFTQQKAEWQVTRLAVMHGLYSGACYGGAVGFMAACWYR